MVAISKEDILKAISDMSVMDIVELVKEMEDKFGVSAAVAAVQAVSSDVKSDASVEEQTEFNVMLTSFGSNKISVIKVARALTGLGLKEAKTMVESAPVAIKEGVPKEEAEEIKKQFEEVGATVEIK